MTTNIFKQFSLIVVFLVLIFFPFINGKLKIYKDSENTENRKPAEKPAIDINHLDDYPGLFDKYYNDNFSVRQSLIKSFNGMNLVVFKKSPMPDQVQIGNNGWLYLGGNELKSYQGKNKFTTDELETIKQELEYRKQYLEKKGIKFYFMVSPEKAIIYSENMPMNLVRLSQESWGEQLVNYLNEYSTIKLINLYPVLRNHKNYGLLYYKLDNHWNKKGAFFAANEVLKTIKKDFPSIDTFSFSDLTIKDSIIYSGNLSNMLSKTELFSDSAFSVEPKTGFLAVEKEKVAYPVIPGFAYPTEYEYEKEVPNSKKPKILIISDSFGIYPFSFLAEKFSRSVKIFDAWQYKLNEDIVDAEKPDIVLIMGLESNLKNMLNYLSKDKKASVFVSK